MTKKGVIGRTPGVYQGETMLLSINFGSECTYVGENAFKDCQSLDEINNDNVLEEIGSNAFAGTKLKSVHFDKLSKLHNNAFMGCADLNYISMPICKDIPNEAFANCSSLTNIDFPNFSDTTIIGTSAFAGCKNLKTVNNNSSKIAIQDSAFCECVNISEIKLDNCIEIGKSAFLGCSNIKHITLDKCNMIEEDAFKDCINLKNVYISIGEGGRCDLKGSNAFRVGNDENKKNNSINIFVDEYFYKMYMESSSSNYWLEYYQDNIIKTVNSNQIVYTSVDNNLIELSEESIIGNRITNNEYFSTYGVITFENDITSLNSKLFIDTGMKNLLSITLPSTCVEIGEEVFSGCEMLDSVTLPNTVTTIGAGAFKNCKKLTSFTIPDRITTLGEGVFVGCENIKKFEGKNATYGGNAVVLDGTLICVTPKSDNLIYNISEIDQNIHTLGAYCFSGCKKIRRVDISENINNISNHAFDGCENLREIHFIDSTVPQIGDEVFSGCQIDLIKIFVPEQYFNTYYEYWTMNGVDNKYLSNVYPMAPDKSIIYFTNNAENITLNNISKNPIQKVVNDRTYYITSDMSSVPIDCFNKSSVSEVILGKNVTIINKGAFKECDKLNYIYLSDNITKLGDECFWGCTSLQNIHIPQKAYDFGDNIFFGCSNLKEFVSYKKEFVSEDNRCYIDNGTLKFFASGSLNNNENEMEYIVLDNITTIDKMAFNGSGITKISLPQSTKIIGKHAFANCKSLKSISQWAGVTTISLSAFSGCESLTNVIIPDSVTEIGSMTFFGCTGLESITIGNSVTSIGYSAFSGCDSLKSITIPDSVTEIEYSTFEGCESIESVKIGNGVTSIGKGAFYNCTSLTSITIGNKVTNIGQDVFINCTSLKSITIPNSVTSIGSRVFLGCGSLTSITIPDRITSIGYHTFAGCGSLTNITIPNSVTTIGESAFSECISLTSVTIPDRVKTIGKWAFYNCTSLTSVTIGNSVTSIGDYAFYVCSSLTSITIPDSVTSIGREAFWGCTSLTSVHCKSSTPPTGGVDMFKNNSSGRKIYVPVGTINAYRGATYWKDYASSIVVYRYIFNTGLDVTPVKPSV